MKKDINLKDKKFKRNKSQRPLTSIFVVLIVAIMFSFFFVMNLLLKKQITGVEMEIKKIEDSLKGEEFQKAYNFGADLIKLENLIINENFLPRTSEILEVSDSTLSSIHFSNLVIQKEENSSIFEAEVFFKDYSDLINQIKIYKEMEGVKNFSVREIKKSEEEEIFSSTIEFELEGKKSQKSNSEDSVK